MKFEWIDFEKSGNSYLSLDGIDVAEAYNNENSYIVYPSNYGIVFFTKSQEYPDLETAKKAVETQIYNFCVEFNIWYMR